MNSSRSIVRLLLSAVVSVVVIWAAVVVVRLPAQKATDQAGAAAGASTPPGLAGGLASTTASEASAAPKAGDTTLAAAAATPRAIDVRLAPDSPPAAPEGPYLGHRTTYDRAPPTVALTTQISKAVIIGEITEVGPSRWNTADEMPPAEPNRMLGTDAMRILRVHVVQAITRGAPDQDATIWIPGGDIGCHQFLVDGFPATPTVGSRFALFLNDVVPANGVQGLYGVFQLWPLADDGKLQTPEDGTISTTKFATLVVGAESTQAP